MPPPQRMFFAETKPFSPDLLLCVAETRQLFGYAEVEDDGRWAAIAQTEVAQHAYCDECYRILVLFASAFAAGLPAMVEAHGRYHAEVGVALAARNLKKTLNLFNYLTAARWPFYSRCVCQPEPAAATPTAALSHFLSSKCSTSTSEFPWRRSSLRRAMPAQLPP